MQALVPAAVLQVCETLRGAGYQAWVVGGAVRDLLLGKIPSDWDVASDCLPETVLTLFSHTIATGLQHGTVTAVVGSGRKRENVEITTFRGEGAYSDGRRPDEVSFGVPLDEDLKRRDFVINAMAFDPITGRVHDPFGGQQDLETGCVRAVGDASERFNEDGLRVMRAVRFVSTLGFTLEHSTEAGLRTALDSLAKVAQERVRVELLKLLGGKAATEALVIAERNGVLHVILPELDELDRAAAFARVALLQNDEVLRLAGLLADVPCDLLERVLRRLTMSNEDRHRVMAALRFYKDFASVAPDPASLRRHLSAVGRAACLDHLALVAARAAQMGESASLATIAEARRILDSGVPLEVGDLAIGGAQVMKLTGAKGPLIGVVLRGLLDRVLEEPELNVAETLESLVSDLADSGPA
jgi:tRNA nucleotidyltransferase (CCA-adding enzyme)